MAVYTIKDPEGDLLEECVNFDDEYDCWLDLDEYRGGRASIRPAGVTIDEFYEHGGYKLVEVDLREKVTKEDL